MAKEKDIDCMKYRKSTHLAGVDVEMIIADQGKCVLTIKEAYYDTNVNVSGNKTSGYFLEFVEEVKPMVVNSGNRKNIAGITKIKNQCTASESRNIGNWTGMKTELILDPNVKMMGQKTGGIKVLPVNPIPDVSDIKALELLNCSKNAEDLKANWISLSGDEKALPTVVALKEKLKIKFTK